MDQHKLEVKVSRPASAVAEVLGTRPASWMRLFLRLAALGGASRGTHGADEPWFRLGPVRGTPSGTLAVRFIWWPHADPGLFARFRGQVLVEEQGEQSILILEGQSWDGQPHRNTMVLSALLDLLAEAL